MSVGMIYKPAVNTVADLTATYPDAKTGWAAKVNAGGYIYQFDGTTWNNTGLTAFSDDVLIKSDAPPIEALALSINTEKSDTVTKQMIKGLKAFNVFRLVLYTGFENEEYFIFGLYNWDTSGGVPLFKVGKLVNGNRVQITTNHILAGATDPYEVHSNMMYKMYLTDGAGYIEFSIDMGLYGGYNPSEPITYLHELDNKELYIKPSKIETKGTLFKRVDLEYYRNYYYDFSGNRITGDHASQKSAVYPIQGNLKRLKITTTISGHVPVVVFLDENMKIIKGFGGLDGVTKYKNFEIPYYSNILDNEHVLSRAAYIAINGHTGDEQSLWIEDTEGSEFKLGQLNIPVSSYQDSAFWNMQGLQSGDYADMCFVELPCTQKDVIAVSQYMYAPAAPLAVYEDKGGNLIYQEAGGAQSEHEFYYLTIPKEAVKVYINASIYHGRLKVFVSGKVSDYLNTQLTAYNKADVNRTNSSYFDNSGQLQTGDYAAQSATKHRVFQNEEYLISSITSGFVSLLIVLDIKGNVIEYKENATVNENRTFTDYYYKIPANGFWLLVNGTTGNDLTIKRKSIEPVTRAALADIGNNLTYIWLDGKWVLWLGTSIPAGGQYPERSCANVGAKCTNQALGASFIRLGDQNPSTSLASNNSDIHRVYSLVESQAEKVAIWSSKATPAQLEIAKNASYEVKLLPYLTGEKKVDLIVLDFGFNDRNNLGTIEDLRNRNKATFVGAMAWIIELIRSYDFHQRILIATHYDCTMNVFNAANMCNAQELVGNTLGVEVFKVYEKTGWSNQWIPNTSGLYPTYPRYEANPANGDLTLLQCWMPDGFHPHSDTTGKSQNMLTNVYTNYLKNFS